jgi:hypothetical protein
MNGSKDPPTSLANGHQVPEDSLAWLPENTPAPSNFLKTSDKYV